jgi:hypothetical protein
MDAEALIISNYFREIRVPLSDMEKVSEDRGLRQVNRVTITFRHDTSFGRRIVFMPPFSWANAGWIFSRGKQDPIVRELRALIRH